jgi:hypothetical protein
MQARLNMGIVLNPDQASPPSEQAVPPSSVLLIAAKRNLNLIDVNIDQGRIKISKGYWA